MRQRKSVRRNRAKYFLIHFKGTFLIKDNTNDRGTLVKDAPIFLDEGAAWKWVMNNYE